MRTVMFYAAGLLACIVAQCMSIMHLSGPRGVSMLALIVFIIASVVGVILACRGIWRSVKAYADAHRQVR